MVTTIAVRNGSESRFLQIDVIDKVSQCTFIGLNNIENYWYEV